MEIIPFLHTFFLAMKLYPEVQRKAQEETDSPNLPYVEVAIKELLRWDPVTNYVPTLSHHWSSPLNDCPRRYPPRDR